MNTHRRHSASRFFSTLCFLTALMVPGLSPSLAIAGGKPGVVIQVSENDPAKWNLALNNAGNLIQALGGPDKVDIEIVAYGPGLAMLKADSVVGERLGVAVSDGIHLSACHNTMRAKHVEQRDLYLGVDVVPAGVLEIMQRQQGGWAYIRP
ncbi:hypothetical protein G3580_17575 [Nitrogeniibacter mangrovi]|uniref:Uncharacterized protein n=1 Tax=Nitrogeniibacter mangrovi TaxID=2016596 RepID=A0A6C1B943_9RHOO|nr:DsrE family protein [Nitrogeniibacter mangrovi]QID19268.1 hypothetical protein G3580_17575 [Nitrogeniibacter mangrovi]